MEYLGDNYDVKIGNLYSLYGRGLSLNMSQDQTIDFDNSVIGIELKYSLNDFNFFLLSGVSQFNYRSNPTQIEADLYLRNLLGFLGADYYSESLGSFQYTFLNENAIIDSNNIRYYTDTKGININKDLEERINLESVYIPSYDTLTTFEHNLSWTNSIYGIDLYFENALTIYTKILGDRTFGSKFYASFYRDFKGFGVTYEYKNYNQKYHIQTVSNSPTVFRIGTSTLASRNSHSMNWGDEIGHQIEVNRSFFNNFSLLANISMSYRHEDKDSSISFIDAVLLDPSKNIYDQYPFRQYYFEISGWMIPDIFYFKIGMDQFNELEGHKLESNSAFTIPTIWTINIGKGNSVTTYYEKQYVNWIKWTPQISDKQEDKDYINNYFSLSFNYGKLFSVSYFYENQNYEKKIFGNTWSEGLNVWQGLDLTGNINSTTQVSLFYGSQKGGLVCANGVCAEQPGFDNGVKITLRSIF